MGELSDRLGRRIELDFPDPGSAPEVRRLVASTSDTERVQAAVVLAAQGDVDELQRQVELAAIDWRDVLMNGGLADEHWSDLLDAELGPNQ